MVQLLSFKEIMFYTLFFKGIILTSILFTRKDICTSKYKCNILRKTIEGYGFCFDFIPKGIIFSTQIINRYCKFGNFRVTFISRIFYFRIIGEVLNSRTDTCTVYKAYYNSLLARILFSRGNEFANISEN